MKGSMLIKGCNYEEHLQLYDYQVKLRLMELLNTPGDKWAIIDIYSSNVLIDVYREGSCGSHDSLHIIAESKSEFNEIMELIRGKVDKIRYFDYTHKSQVQVLIK